MNWLRRFRGRLAALVLAIAVFFGWQEWAAAVSQLIWTPPTQNTDGTPLTDLAGFKVYRGDVGGPYTIIADVQDASATGYTDANTVEGWNCYVVTAYDAAGNESDYSNEACKFIDTIRPNPPSGLAVQ